MTKANKGSGKRERRAFSAEFKVEAVRLLRERQQLGVSLAQIGRELDVGPDVLRCGPAGSRTGRGVPRAMSSRGMGSCRRWRRRSGGCGGRMPCCARSGIF